NAAPNPAQALPTRFNIVSFGDQAIQIAIIATNKTDNLPTRTNSFSCVLALYSPRISLSKYSVTELEVTNNCDVLVLLVAAKLADHSITHTCGWNNIWLISLYNFT